MLRHMLGKLITAGGARGFAASETAILPPEVAPPPGAPVAARPPEPPAEALRDQVRPHWRPPQRTWEAAWIVARREMRDVVSDWRIVAPALLLVVVFPLLLVVLSAQGSSLLVRRVVGFNVAGLVPFGMMIVGFFPVSFSLMMALETFAGEKERNTLEALFSTPLSDRALYYGKTLAALVPPLIASYLSMFIYLGGVMLTLHYRPDGALILSLLVLDLSQALVMVASALVISSHTTSVRAANLLASFIILPMSLVLQFNNIFVIWGAAPYLWLVALGLGLFAALLLRVGLRLFNREDILTREAGDLRGGQMWAIYRQFLRLPPRAALLARTPDAPAVPPRLARPGLRRLYLHDIPAILRLRWPELALVAVALATAFAIGWVLAARFPLPFPAPAGATLVGPGQTGSVGVVVSQGGAAALAQIPLLVLGSLVLAGLLIGLALISFGLLPILFMMLIAGAFGFLLHALAGLGLPPAAILLALALPQISFPALAFLLFTAFAMRFGLAIAAPPHGFSLGESLLLAAAEYTKILALALPLLVAGYALQALLFLLFR